MHAKAKRWENSRKKREQKGPRPCDWCGCDLDETETYLHEGTCAHCGRRCIKQEQQFYIQLGYDGDSDIKVPPGYEIRIPLRLD